MAIHGLAVAMAMAWLWHGLAIAAMAWLWLWPGCGYGSMCISKLHCAHRDLIRTNGIFDVLRQTLTAATDQEA